MKNCEGSIIKFMDNDIIKIKYKMYKKPLILFSLSWKNYYIEKSKNESNCI